MSGHAVIQADYTTWRNVAGRKVLQLIFEVPIEQTADVMKRLGVPMPGESRWCAIALLENGGRASESDAGIPRETPRLSSATDAATIQTGTGSSHTIANTAAAGTSEIPKERRPFASLPLSQQAAMRCQEGKFRRFLAEKYPTEGIAVYDLDMAADEVRHQCGVKSRTQIVYPGETGEEWNRLEGEYQSWLTDERYASVAR